MAGQHRARWKRSGYVIVSGRERGRRAGAKTTWAGKHTGNVYGVFATVGDDGATFYNDSGAAARFYNIVRNEEELIDYLRRFIAYPMH